MRASVTEEAMVQAKEEAERRAQEEMQAVLEDKKKTKEEKDKVRPRTTPAHRRSLPPSPPLPCGMVVSAPGQTTCDAALCTLYYEHCAVRCV